MLFVLNFDVTTKSAPTDPPSNQYANSARCFYCSLVHNAPKFDSTGITMDSYRANIGIISRIIIFGRISMKIQKNRRTSSSSLEATSNGTRQAPETRIHSIES